MHAPWLQVAAVMGFLGVAFGAFGAHALAPRRNDKELNAFKTGVLYHLAHTPVVLVLGFQPSADVDLVATLLVAGVAVFSGSLYALGITRARKLGAITPIGGLLMLAGWGVALVKLGG
jgi:uncharacterized membrane protein YgdD (TMEM256/DUF423 family)